VALIANTQEIFFSSFHFLFSTSPCIRQESLPSLRCYQQSFIPPITFGVNVCNLHAKTDRALSPLRLFLFKLFVSLEDKEPNRSPLKNKDVSSLFQRVLLWPLANVFVMQKHKLFRVMTLALDAKCCPNNRSIYKLQSEMNK
nr:hypothetical protein [Tanacetum cinerariifolium]